MAQHFIDFSNDEAGLIPQGFTSRWNSTTWEVVEDTGSIGGKVLRNTGGANNPKHLGYSALGNMQDVEVLAKVKNTTNGASQNRLHLRASESNVSCYAVGLWANQIRIFKYVNGTFGALGQYDFSMQVNTWYMLRFRVNGNNLYAKIWEYGNEEPAGWQITTTDNSLVSGEVGFGGWDMSGVRYFDVLGIGTDGDFAPTGIKKDYKPNGSYTTMPIQTSGELRIRWLEEKPTNTNIIIEYTTGETQGQWQVVSNGDAITSDTNLWIRATLSTEDTSVTPVLQALWIEEASTPQDKILITIDWWSRFNNVEDKIKVLYDASKGSLTGAGGAVESFEIEFTPQDLVQTPNPNEEELIKAYPYEIKLDLNELEFKSIYAKPADNLIQAYPYDITLTLTDVGEINP